MRVVSELDALVDSVRRSANGIVAIDGLMRSGKSWLANALGQRSGLVVHSLDSFVAAGPAPYPDMLDMERLRLAVQSTPVCIVEGILVREVLQRLQARPTLHIYVRRWVSESELESPDYWGELSAEELIEQENELCRLAGAADDVPMLARELSHYHQQFRPFEAADVIYENLHSD